MQVFLSAHPSVSFLPEINLVRRFLLNNKFNSIQIDEGSAGVLKQLNADAKLSRLSHSWEEIIRQTGTCDDFSKGLFQELVNTHATPETEYVGYKDALLIQEPEKILNFWPDSRIVHIFRDPRDVLASRKKADWSKHYSDKRNLVAGLIQLEIIERCKKAGLASKIIDVKYEKLLQEPEESARALCEFLQLEYSNNMLNFNQNADELVFADEMQWKKNLFSPLLKGNSGKWQKELSPQEIALVESSYGNEMRRLSYESSKAYDSLSLPQKMLIWPQLLWLRAVKFGYLAKRKWLEAK